MDPEPDKMNDADDDTKSPPLKRMRSSGAIENVGLSANADDMDIDLMSFEQGSVSLSKIDDLVDVLLNQLEDLRREAVAVGTKAPMNSLTKDDKTSSENAAAATATTTTTTSESLNGTPLSSKVTRPMSHLSRGLLLLRTWQRGLMQHCSSLERSCQETCLSQQRTEQVWASLQYEKQYLQQEIARVQNFTMPNLEQVLQQHRQQQQQQQQQQQALFSSHENHNNNSESPTNFLEPDNPAHRGAILQHLQSEIQRRSELEKERDRLKAQLVVVHTQYQRQQKRLKQLPDQLAALEQASLLCQQFFSIPFLGTTRTQQNSLALRLPPPLYTLFMSLQGYLDLHQPSVDEALPHNLDEQAHQTNDSMHQMSLSIVTVPATPEVMAKNETESSASMATPMPDNQPLEIQWSLPVPDIAAKSVQSNASPRPSTTNTVTIHFRHHPMPEKTNLCCIKATTASSSPMVIDTTWLLSNLFRESATTTTTTASAFMSTEQEEYGYYRWCHYLAGIHWMGPTVSSTRAIVQTLQRRIRANATLKYILHSLSNQHKIPTPPITNRTTETTKSSALSWQIVSFSQQQPSVTTSLLGDDDEAAKTRNGKRRGRTSSPICIFDIHCKKVPARKNGLELRATVTIDKAQYPSVPPRWKLLSSPSRQQPEDKNAGSSCTTVYNGTWNRLEQLVNCDLLTTTTGELFPRKESAPVATTSPDKLEEKDVENVSPAESEDTLLFAEWILIHQLNRLLDEWEATSTSLTSGVGMGKRVVRGRDRMPLSLMGD